MASSSSLRQTTTTAAAMAMVGAESGGDGRGRGHAPLGRSVSGRKEGQQKRDLWKAMKRTTFWGRLVFLALTCQKRRFLSSRATEEKAVVSHKSSHFLA